MNIITRIVKNDSNNLFFILNLILIVCMDRFHTAHTVSIRYHPGRLC